MRKVSRSAFFYTFVISLIQIRSDMAKGKLDKRYIVKGNLDQENFDKGHLDKRNLNNRNLDKLKYPEIIDKVDL